MPARISFASNSSRGSRLRSVLARTLWLLGFAEQALQTAEQNVQHAVALGHAVTLYNSLLAASQVALLSGDLTVATRYVVMLRDHSSRHAMGIWTSWADGLQGVLRIRQGDAAAGLPILRAALEELGEARSVPRFAVLFGAYATGLAQSGQIAEGLAAIGEALEHCRVTTKTGSCPSCCASRATYGKAGLADSMMGAEDHYLRSLDCGARARRCFLAVRTPSALLGFGMDSDAPEKRANCCRRFTIALPRGSRLPTCKPRRRFSVRSRDLPSAHRLGGYPSTENAFAVLARDAIPMAKQAAGSPWFSPSARSALS